MGLNSLSPKFLPLQIKMRLTPTLRRHQFAFYGRHLLMSRAANIFKENSMKLNISLIQSYADKIRTMHSTNPQLPAKHTKDKEVWKDGSEYASVHNSSCRCSNWGFLQVRVSSPSINNRYGCRNKLIFKSFLPSNKNEIYSLSNWDLRSQTVCSVDCYSPHCPNQSKWSNHA